jgi:hypothetical protein
MEKILKLVQYEQSLRMWIGFSWLRIKWRILTYVVIK